MAEASTPVEIFCSYAHEDEMWRRKLETHLSLLKRRSFISLWHDRLIAPGTDWTKTIDTHLETASVILLLVSADFFASDYCYGIEMKRALERQEAGETRVIPILVRQVDWNSAPFKHLQILPSSGKPITLWRNRDAAFADVAGGIRSAIESLPSFSTRVQSPLPPLFWHMPPARNPFFTGREEYLRYISNSLKGEMSTSAVAPLALCGLGGIGKTQIATEYVYRHRSEYQAVFWVEADSYETILANFVAIAAMLNLLGADEQLLLSPKEPPPRTSRNVVPVQALFLINQQEGLVRLFQAEQQRQSSEIQAHPEASNKLSYLIGTVKRWFDTQTDWLLILNNVEDLKVIKEFLPPARGGHILLTTRAQSLGDLAQSVVIEKMDLEESIRFLLRRVKVVPIATQPPSTSEATHIHAKAIVQELDNIPLALDQAGAYIEETGCGLAGYLARYRKQRIQLLQRRGGENPPHPEPIATTVSLCFENVEKDSPVAANILRLCAFLHPSGVPEDLIEVAHFDPLLQSVAVDLLKLDAAIEVLRRFSLVNRIPEASLLIVHRLVQVILRDAMDKEAQQQWIERTVRLVNQVLSDGQTATWQAYFPHVQSCLELIMQQELCFPEAVQLLHQAGVYLKDQVLYKQAILFLRQAIEIQDQLHQPDHSTLISLLDALAEIYSVESNYDEALLLLQRTLSLREQALGTNHFKIASNLDNLAMIYLLQGEYEEAERLFERALMLREQTLGENHLDLVGTLNNLAILNMEQNHFAEADPFLQRILLICTKVLGENHPDTSRARENYINLLQKMGRHAEAETLAAKSAARSTPALWNLPYPRNSHFTGRDELLDRLHQQLMPIEKNDLATTHRVAQPQPQVIKGLGGIGKTQIAVEYAYRSRDLGQYKHTFWINAASEEAVLADFVSLAEMIPALPTKRETDRRKLVEAVKRWFEQCKERWLLIFDNADDMTLIRDYLPQEGNGSILVVTRAHAVGSLAISIEVETMGFIEGTHLLLRRAHLFEHASDEEINQAGDIVVALDHFPLALDQAGAYIEETQCSLVDYLNLYRTHGKDLLARRGMTSINYPYSVATTWSLSFAKIEQANPAAAELLRLCAFLAPEAIPEDLIRSGATHWSPLLQQAVTDPIDFDHILAELLRFSLIKRFAETHVLGIHRLLQTVLIGMMEPEVQRRWAERVIHAVDALFPHNVQDATTWAQCLRYLEQAQVCAFLIRQHKFAFSQAADLLNRTGVYLREQALYSIAEPLLEDALHINEQQLGLQHPNTAQSLNNLALLYQTQHKYDKAEQLFLRALNIQEQTWGFQHSETAETMHKLAQLREAQGKVKEARTCYTRTLTIREQALGAHHSKTTETRANLIALLHTMGKHEEAALLEIIQSEP